MTGPVPPVHLVVPDSTDNSARPSGGNVYNRRMATGLTALGWQVAEHPLPGSWPRPAREAAANLGALVAGFDDGAVVLIDGIIALSCADMPNHAARLRLVVVVHMLVADPHDAGSVERERGILQSATAVATPSRWLRGQLVERYGIARERIAAVAPGTDPADTAPGSDGGGALLCVAAVIPDKGHATLLAALARLGDRDWTCTCVGALDLDRAHAESLRRQAHESGLGSKVHFTGALGRDALNLHFAAADVLVLASRAETYGMVVTEALAHGLPVIATAVGGVPESLGRTRSGAVPGLLVPPDDPEALAGAVRRWLTDAELRHQLRAAAAERRGALAGWDTAAKLLSGVLQGVLTREVRRA